MKPGRPSLRDIDTRNLFLLSLPGRRPGGAAIADQKPPDALLDSHSVILQDSKGVILTDSH